MLGNCSHSYFQVTLSSRLFGTRGIAFCPTIIFKKQKLLLATRNYSLWTTGVGPEAFVNGWMPLSRIHSTMNRANGVQKSVPEFTDGVRKWIGSAWTAKPRWTLCLKWKT
jgi:hypothetical protein